MSNLRDKLKRQTEILGLCLENPRSLTRADLEAEFERDSPTITRDLRELRELGIDIHSTKHGVEICSKVSAETLRELIVQYIGMSHSSVTYDRATAYLIRRQRDRALIHIVMLQRSIEFGRMAVIDYEKTPGKIEKNKIVCPLMLFQGENEWRLLATHEGVRKQYIVSKMKKVEQTAKTFEKPDQEELHQLITSSWNSWLGGPFYSIKIEISAEWMERIGHRQFTSNQTFIKREDGSAILEAKVNGLSEVAAWIVSRGKGIRVLEPAELKKRVLTLAKDTISNY
jgi:predicted DNA-binding transcriptional regulator YafY